jgi:hypothetical protein
LWGFGQKTASEHPGFREIDFGPTQVLLEMSESTGL